MKRVLVGRRLAGAGFDCCSYMLLRGHPQIRIPNPEIRKKLEIRRPKSQRPIGRKSSFQSQVEIRALRASDFGFLSAFGIRNSEFGFISPFPGLKPTRRIITWFSISPPPSTFRTTDPPRVE